MAFCRVCGSEMHENAIVCTKCGVAKNNFNNTQNTNVVDNGGFGWGLLGCCIPWVGLTPSPREWWADPLSRVKVGVFYFP